jgi:hypothetical protein
MEIRTNVHTGNISYLGKLHRERYGTKKYWMKMLKQWSDGKMTVQFVKREMAE